MRQSQKNRTNKLGLLVEDRFGKPEEVHKRRVVPIGGEGKRYECHYPRLSRTALTYNQPFGELRETEGQRGIDDSDKANDLLPYLRENKYFERR